MLFTEPVFLFVFLPVVLAAYFVAPRRLRNPLLLAASLLFYVWGQKRYLIVLLLSVLLNYLFGRAIGRCEEMERRRSILVIGTTLNLLLLGAFKYPGFVVLNLNRILRVLHFAILPMPTVSLPLGISFFTLMGLSYLIDVYRKSIEPEKRLGVFTCYLTLFPYVTAGPIVRYAGIAKEFFERRVSINDFALGIRRFTVGLGKKMLIANFLGLTVDSIFTVPLLQLRPGVAWLAAVTYAIQLYFDISGYADMAIGLGLMFGFHLPENFNYPYIAESMTDFWKRWHMTLVAWFRDYLFFPLSYRRPVWRIHLNLILVFFLCGLWHEGSWRFIAWGVVHGSLLAFERAGLARWLVKSPRVFRHLYVIFVIVTSSVLVRATSLADALRVWKNMMGITSATGPEHVSTYLSKPLMLALVLGALGCLPVIPALRKWQERFSDRLEGAAAYLFDTGSAALNLAALALVFLASVSFAAAGTYKAFIYFQF